MEKIAQKAMRGEVINQLPQNYVQALEALLSSEKNKLALEQQVSELRRTKGQISTHREASAMGKAGVAVKKVNKLQAKLDMLLDTSTDYATIKAVESRTKAKYAYAKLRACCKLHEFEIRDVPDVTHGSVKSYPWQAWKAVYNVDIKSLLAVK